MHNNAFIFFIFFLSYKTYLFQYALHLVILGKQVWEKQTNKTLVAGYDVNVETHSSYNAIKKVYAIYTTIHIILFILINLMQFNLKY